MEWIVAIFWGSAAAVVASGAGLLVLKNIRMQRVMREPLSSRECPACESTTIETLAPQCYRCTECNLTWGDGLDAFQAAQRASQLQHQPAEERRRVTISEFKEAELRLRDAEAWLDEACNQLVGDLLFDGVVDGSDSYSQTRTQTMARAMQEVLAASKHMRHGSEALGDDAAIANIDTKLNPWLLQFDTLLRSKVIDLMAHHKASTLRKTVQETRAQLRLLISQLEQDVVR